MEAKSIRISDTASSLGKVAYKAIQNNDIKSFKEALKENRYSVVNYVDISHKNMTSLTLASSLGSEECVSLLIDAGSNVNAKDDDDMTPLMHASMNSHIGIVNILIFFNVDVTLSNNNGCNALHLAAAGDNLDIVTALVGTQKMDINKRDNTIGKMTPILYAAKNGNALVLRYLLSITTETDAKDSNNKTLLALAAEGGHTECFLTIIDVLPRSLSEFLQTYKKTAANFIIKFATERKKEFDTYSNIIIDSIIETERLDLAILLLISDVQLIQPGLRNTDGIFVELCSKKYLEVDDLVARYPKALFKTNVLLTYCKSPVKILNKLYEEKENEDSIISAIIRTFFVAQDKGVIMSILCYQKALVNASHSHPLEQEDLDLWIAQLECLLLELFKSKSLDNSDYMLQLLLPSLNLNEYDDLDNDIQINIHRLTSLGIEKNSRYLIENRVDEQRKLQDDFLALHRSWALAHFEKTSVLSYCVSQNLKLLFQCSQVSGIIESVFYATLVPTKTSIDDVFSSSICSFTLRKILNNSGRKSLFLFIGRLLKYPSIVYPVVLDTFTAKEEVEISKIITLLENLRYCPFAMFIAEVMSKLATIGLVSYISLTCYRQEQDANNNDDLKVGTCDSHEPEIYIIIMLSANIIYEIGQLDENHWNFYRYFNTWNILDLISIGLLSFWASGFLTNSTLYLRIFLPLSAVPLSLGLLQSVSIVKSVGQLIIMIRAMVVDLFSMFILFCVITFGFAVTMSGLAYQTQAYKSFYFSFQSLFSATLGNFQFFDLEPEEYKIGTIPKPEQNNNAIEKQGYAFFNLLSSKITENVCNALLTLYLLGATVLLLNLLIARMANTHNRIDNRSLQEWSYFMGQTLQSYVLIREKSSLCLLPAPFNLLTSFLFPIQYFLKHRGGVVKTISLAGTMADFILLICGAVLSIPFMILFIIHRFGKLVSYLYKSSFRGSYLLLSILSFLFPLYLVYIMILHILALFTTLPIAIYKRPFVFTLENGVIDGFQSSLANQTVDQKRHDSTFGYEDFNPLASQREVEMSSHTRIEDDDRVSRYGTEKVHSMTTRVFFSLFDIENIMKTIRVRKQLETFGKQLEKLDLKFDQMNAKYDLINSKYDSINSKLSHLMQGLEELKSKKSFL